MSSRKPQRSTRIKNRKSILAPEYQNLEPRNLLAGIVESSVAIPVDGSSSLIYTLAETQPVENRIEVLRSHLDLGTSESVDLISLDRDQYGFAHFKYQQLYNQVPVENSVYSVHVRDGQIVSLSGEFKEVSNVALAADLNGNEALQSALDHVDATTYMWQIETQDAEGNHRFHGNDETLHQLPKGELVYFTDAAGDVSLTYKFDVYAIEPFSRAYIYVDANSGEVKGEIDRIRNIDTPASGTSVYNGEVEFTADTNGKAFRLRTSLIGADTLDMGNGFVFGNAIDFISFDNVFNQPQNLDGVQVHWGTEQTLAFYASLGRMSYDGMGATVTSYVNFGTGQDLAFWDGTAAVYGDGAGATTSYTSLDIVGHEISHGLNDTTAGLLNMNEPGALSESFSDIFGEMVERFATGTNNWELQTEVGSPARSMADPKLYEHPDTYLGEFWSTEPTDNGGVHTNNGVQNKWFYLMSEGGAGTNDNGDVYDITGLGTDVATQIAWRNLTVYLTPDSSYADSRDGAIQAAIDLYGEDSNEHLTTVAAWEAVGVYGQLPSFELLTQVSKINPVGSLIHHTSVSGTHDGMEDVYYGMNLDANQTLTIRVEGADDFIPSIEVINSQLEELADINGTESIEIADGVAIPTEGLYVFGVQSDVAGDFTIDIWLNTNLEEESYLSEDLSNDTFATAQSIESSAITLAGEAQRLAVLGDLSADNDIAILGDDFESGELGDQWTTSSSDIGGRIFITDSFAANTGSFSLLMDQNNEGSPNLNEAIVSFDLSQQINPTLSFAHAEFNDETNELPDVFKGSFDGDGVSISDDGITWHTILNSTDTPAGEWTTETYDLVALAEELELELNSNFQVKFQQFDNFRADTDGRAFDDIQIIVPDSNADWYSFGIRDGQYATIVATSTRFNPGNTRVDIYNQDGELVLMGTNGIGGTSSASQIFGEGEEYYARVAGTTEYSLVVTRGADFDTGSNDGGEDNTQILFNHQGVLGHIALQDARGAEPDNALSQDIISNFFAGVTLSNETTGGDVFAASAAAFGAPTGNNVFAPTPFQANGWRENINEFRADFATPQASVSIDFGSDDDTDIGRLRAYHPDGTFIGEMLTESLAIGEKQTLTFTRDIPDIGYIIATGVGGDVIPLDNLVFEDASSDPDVYSLIVFYSQQLDFEVVLPGGGDGLFRNGLVTDDGAAVNLELVNPIGVVVATGTNSISYFAPMQGVYEVRVSAQQNFFGEYFLFRDIEVPTLDVPEGIDFGEEGSTPFSDFDLASTEDYSFGRGYGWVESTQLNAFTGFRGNDLVRDGVSMQDGTFVIDVENGLYDVTIYLGVVTGKIDEMALEVEGVEDVFLPPRGPNVFRNYTANVTDGQLTLRFDGDPGLDRTFRVSGIGLSQSAGRSIVGDDFNTGRQIGEFPTARFNDEIMASAILPGRSNIEIPEITVSTIRQQTETPFAASGLAGSRLDHRQHDEQFANWNIEREPNHGRVENDLIGEIGFNFEDEFLLNI